jgi:uncharacterized protein YcaQ
VSWRGERPLHVELSDDDARRLFVRAQRLDDAARSDGADVAGVVRAVVGLQAQDAGAGSLGVRARLAGATRSAVDRARFEDRTIARAWVMRGTLHFVAAEDVRWMVALLGPVGLRRNAKRIASMGVDSDEAMDAVRSALADGGSLTRQELAEHARRRGVRLADDPQSAAHLAGRAALKGHLCEAEPRGGKPTYVLTDDWLPADARPPFDRDAAVAELARRYLAAHPPAAPQDFASWSGLPIADARAGFAAMQPDLEEVHFLDRTAYVLRGAGAAEGRVVRLLPAWDNFLLAHRDRALTVRPEQEIGIMPGGGVLRPSVMVDGRIEGGWRLDRGKPAIEPFAVKLPRTVAKAVDAEAADVIRFRSG